MTRCTGVSHSPSGLLLELRSRLHPRNHKLTTLARPTAAVISLTALDGLFVIISIAWDFLQDPTCVCNNTCPETPRILEVFEIISLVITSLFLLEIPLSLYSLGLRHYTTAEHAYLHLFDAAVIITTFALEVFLRVSPPDSPLAPRHSPALTTLFPYSQGRDAEVASLLIFARLWRLAKLVSTVTVGTTEVNDIEGRVPGRAGHASPHAREETLMEAVQEGWRREKAALVAELEAAREKVRELEGKMLGVRPSGE